MAAKKGTKTQAGQTEKRTVLKLQPVRYKLALLYLGHDRIAQDPSTYRCKYELHRGTNPITVKPELIPNQVRGDNIDPSAIKAATPAAHGGDPTNPPADEIYRVMITDNHGQRSADSAFLGRPDGDKHSKPDNYKTLDWLKDISPAVPFRVVVKKFFGSVQTDFDKDFKAVFEIKDPVEEFEEPPPPPPLHRRQFLQDFFNKYNRTDSNPDAGDDNASTSFGGKRHASASYPGVKAADVLKDAAYASPPVVDLPPGGTGNVKFSSLSAAPVHETSKAHFGIVARDDGNGGKVGITDLAFLPAPVGGDNYRFLVTLVHGSSDIRDLKENGAPAILVDDADKEIPKPRAYVTGRFVIWKKVQFRLVVLVNNTTAASVTWPTIQTMYARDFIQVDAPDASKHFNISAAAWRQELGNEFGDPTLSTPNFSNPANFNAAAYAAGLFPAFLQPQATTDRTEHLSRRIISHACADPAVNINPDPATDTKQKTLDGLFIVLIKLAAPLVDFSAAGAYFGDRMFWFLDQGSPAATTTTCAHELGHALYLRHSHTAHNNSLIQYTDSGGTVSSIDLQNTNIANPVGNSADMFEDHDQQDSYACLMSYRRGLLSEPCGMCALTLRLYDRVAIQKQYVNQIMDGFKPAKIVLLSLVGGAWQLTENVPNIPVGGLQPLLAVSQAVPFTDRAGNNSVGRANISCAANNPASLWSKSGPGDVSITVTNNDKVLVKGTRAGEVTVRYSNRGVDASVKFQIT